VRAVSGEEGAGTAVSECVGECAPGGEVERRGDGEGGAGDGDTGGGARKKGGGRPEVGEDPDKRAPLVGERERGGREAAGCWRATWAGMGMGRG
jgi:hypothetical protein